MCGLKGSCRRDINRPRGIVAQCLFDRCLSSHLKGVLINRAEKNLFEAENKPFEERLLEANTIALTGGQPKITAIFLRIYRSSSDTIVITAANSLRRWPYSWRSGVRVKPDLRACSAKPSHRVRIQWKKRMSKITDDYKDASAKSQEARYVIFME